MTDQPAILGHIAIMRDEDGTNHVQTFGPAHVVTGSVRIIDLPVGCELVIRHVGEAVDE